MTFALHNAGLRTDQFSPLTAAVRVDWSVRKATIAQRSAAKTDSELRFSLQQMAAAQSGLPSFWCHFDDGKPRVFAIFTTQLRFPF